MQREEAQPNRTGLPDQLKAGVESLSGMSLDHVQVHYQSAQPARLNAAAYAQGSEIHVAPGQEQHLPHEAWHVVQQAQGRVKPTLQMQGRVPVNDDAGLEHEADVMGAKAMAGTLLNAQPTRLPSPQPHDGPMPTQLKGKKNRKKKAMDEDHGPRLSHGPRRRLAKEEELAALAAMNRENAAHEALKDLSDDEEEEVDEPVAIAAPAKPTFSELQATGGSVEKIRALLSWYDADQAGVMSRLFRTRKFSSLEALEKAALQKMEEDVARTVAPRDSGSRSNNGSGTVSGLTKGKGDGYRAGEGGSWHVHYDHVKYGTDGRTRVNFNGRSSAAILADLNARTGAHPATGLAACRAWIIANNPP